MLSFKMIFSEKKKSQKPEVEFRVYFFAKVNSTPLFVVISMLNGVWLLYKEYAEIGLTSTKPHTYSGSDGSAHSKPHTYWTQKGRLFIYDTLKKDGILPIMEKEN